MLTEIERISPRLFHRFQPRQLCCKMAVSLASSESNFGESIVVPVIFWAQLSLYLVIAGVLSISDFGETNPPSYHSTPTASLGHDG